MKHHYLVFGLAALVIWYFFLRNESSTTTATAAYPNDGIGPHANAAPTLLKVQIPVTGG